MAFVSGEVVPTSGQKQPFKVVFSQGNTVLSEWPVNSVQEGEAQIVKALRGLKDHKE